MSQPTFFTPFKESLAEFVLPEELNDPFNYIPHPLCLLAAKDLQQHLIEQTEWKHNFGLHDGLQGTIIGKMFGVLVVQTNENEIGYLAAYSGKLAGGYHQSRFVPPVFDALTEGSFLNIGMTELTRINEQIELLEEMNEEENAEAISILKKTRREHSNILHDQLYDSYSFLNASGESKNLRQLFLKPRYKNPPSGAGECAGPKLFQYAYQHHLKPLAMAEFWWGLSPKSATWKHGEFYPACKEKCEVILGFMLGI